MLPENRAFKTAIELENAAGEAHCQEFLDTPSHSPAMMVFKQLNQEDRDHAKGIAQYMRDNGIG